MPRYDASMTDSHAAAGQATSSSSDGIHRVRVLLYSDDITTRDAVRAAAGRRPARDVEVASWHECATAEAVIEAMDAGGVDVVVLDGEATPTGGLGLCRQLKNEIFRCPPVLVLTGRPAGRLAGRLVARRRGRPAPARPDRCRRGHRAPRPRAGHRRLTHVSAPASGAPTWPDLLSALLRGEHLSTDTARWAMDQTMRGEASPVQLAGFLVALRAKGETVEELRGLADVMLEHAHRIEVPGPSTDIVGTGGDRMHSVNISTMASVVVASTGLRVVKHGNRASSSSSGSADVLEELGVSLTLTPEQVAEVGERVGITFCFANAFHPSMRHAAVARRELAVGTAFNALGPLTNPGQPTYAAVGVADARLAPLIAGVFAGRGRPAAVFRGDDGLDELTLATTSTVWWVRRRRGRASCPSPRVTSVSRGPPSTRCAGGTPCSTPRSPAVPSPGEVGPVRDAVVLNAGMALSVAAGLGGAPTREALVAALAAGVRRAEEAIDAGSASALLERWVGTTRELAAG